MFGEFSANNTTLIGEPGIILLTLSDIFNKINSKQYEEYEFAINCSYLEIYNEHIRDLLVNK